MMPACQRVVLAACVHDRVPHIYTRADRRRAMPLCASRHIYIRVDRRRTMPLCVSHHIQF